MIPSERFEVEPFRQPVCVVDDFLPLEVAQKMRACVDAHFAAPEAHRPETHQVWNYWHISELYTYLRTGPEKVIEHSLVSDFVDALRQWSTARLGLSAISWPYLSLYVNGCRQGWHNDALNGRFGFVYSLTRDIRATTGGRTVLLHEGDLFRSRMNTAAAGADFMTSIEPAFNRLVIFDDRVPHGVETVEGVMTPTEGRIVLHGHISDGGPIVDGPLDPEETVAILLQAAQRFSVEAAARIQLQHGPLVLRLEIGASGEVLVCEPVLDRVVTASATDVEWPGLLRLLVRRIRELRFPTADAATTVLQPFHFGGPV
jgi:Rps23 Pro-64 3,4-dihydroxylase Tpa1-like proline 4-hydroxylase